MNFIVNVVAGRLDIELYEGDNSYHTYLKFTYNGEAMSIAAPTFESFDTIKQLVDLLVTFFKIEIAAETFAPYDLLRALILAGHVDQTKDSKLVIDRWVKQMDNLGLHGRESSDIIGYYKEFFGRMENGHNNN